MTKLILGATFYNPLIIVGLNNVLNIFSFIVRSWYLQVVSSDFDEQNLNRYQLPLLMRIFKTFCGLLAGFSKSSKNANKPKYNNPPNKDTPRSTWAICRLWL